MPEEETKLKYITRAILEKWPYSNIKIEVKTISHGFMDYALYINNTLIALIEAKTFDYDKKDYNKQFLML